MRLVIGVLGYSILEPIFKSKQPSDINDAPEAIEDADSLSNLFFSVNNISACGAVTDEGFVLKEGSQFSRDNTESIPGKILSIKNQYIANGTIIDDGGTLVATEDILLSSASYAAAIVAVFMKKDSEIIGNSIKDVIVEPARQHMIPGFVKVKENAIKAGALGVTISGAGPSVIAFSKSSADLKKISLSMAKGFASANTKCQTVICKPSKGAANKRK